MALNWSASAEVARDRPDLPHFAPTLTTAGPYTWPNSPQLRSRPPKLGRFRPQLDRERADLVRHRLLSGRSRGKVCQIQCLILRAPDSDHVVCTTSAARVKSERCFPVAGKSGRNFVQLGSTVEESNSCVIATHARLRIDETPNLAKVWLILANAARDLANIDKLWSTFAKC